MRDLRAYPAGHRWNNRRSRIHPDLRLHREYSSSDAEDCSKQHDAEANEVVVVARDRSSVLPTIEKSRH